MQVVLKNPQVLAGKEAFVAENIPMEGAGIIHTKDLASSSGVKVAVTWIVLVVPIFTSKKSTWSGRTVIVAALAGEN